MNYTALRAKIMNNISADNAVMSSAGMPESTPPVSEPSRYSIPRLLRGLGAIALLASVSIYLYQGFGQGSDISRYLILLAHTVGLAGVGLACSGWLKEQKGARLLLMLTLVFVSANFAIIAAFLYSIIGAPVTELHGSITWVANYSVKTAMLIVSALVVLVPLIFFGFKVIARRSALRFSLVFVVGNLLLLLPSRNEVFMGAIALLLLAGVTYHIVKASFLDVTLKTREGFIAKVILFVPLMILLGRNMFHSVGAIMPLIISVSLLLAARQCSNSLGVKSALRALLESMSILPVLGIAMSSAALVGSELNASLSFIVFIFSIVSSALLFELSLRASSGRHIYGALATLLTTVLVGGNLLLSLDFSSSIYCLISGSALIAFAIFSERRYVLIAGTVLALSGLGYSLISVIDGFEFNHWFGLAGLGVLAIVLGSLVEKYGAAIKARVETCRLHFKSWDY